MAVEIPEAQSVELIRHEHPLEPERGLCTNKAPVAGLRQCLGHCGDAAPFLASKIDCGYFIGGTFFFIPNLLLSW